MAVLVTGGAGFIGSAVSNLLAKEGFKIIVADNLSSGVESNIPLNAEFINIDICSPDLEEIFIKNKIEYVFHFAAQTGVFLSKENAGNDAKNNILGSINVFSLCQKYDVKKVIAISSAAVYGITDCVPITESHKTEPISFYGLSKCTMEKYLQLFDINHVILRPSNIYGPHQSFNNNSGVITKFFKLMNNNEPIEIYGNGNQIRDFLHINDMSQICKKVLALPNGKHTINISSAKGISVNELFFAMSELLGYSKKPVYLVQNDFEIQNSILDNSLMKYLLNYEPQIDIVSGLKTFLQ